MPFYDAPVDHFGMGALASQFGAEPSVVPMRILDDALKRESIQRVDCLKVDVEGFEAAVFRGAERLLRSPHSPLVLFEFCDWAETRMRGGRPGGAQQMLSDWGYRIWRLSDLVRGGAPLREMLTAGFETLVA